MWVDPNKRHVAVVLLIERMDMHGKDQTEIYTTTFKAALDKFGK